LKLENGEIIFGVHSDYGVTFKLFFSNIRNTLLPGGDFQIEWVGDPTYQFSNNPQSSTDSVNGIEHMIKLFEVLKVSSSSMRVGFLRILSILGCDRGKDFVNFRFAYSVESCISNYIEKNNGPVVSYPMPMEMMTVNDFDAQRVYRGPILRGKRTKK